MKREDEDLLIQQAKLGKQDAFTELYDRHHKLIRYIIYDIVKNEDVADDLLSVTFTKAFSRLESYVNPISFEMWLKTIADSNDLSPEEVIMKQETVEQLKVALHKLRSKYRNILELRYFKGLSYEELATELGVPIGTVKSDLNKAKKRLREFFDNINNN